MTIHFFARIVFEELCSRPRGPRRGVGDPITRTISAVGAGRCVGRFDFRMTELRLVTERPLSQANIRDVIVGVSDNGIDESVERFHRFSLLIEGVTPVLVSRGTIRIDGDGSCEPDSSRVKMVTPK